MLDITDYELAWPPELFAAEARRILARPRLGRQAIDLLLREAFHDESAANDLDSQAPGDPWDPGPAPPAPREALAELAKNAHRIRERSAPRPYWPQRHGREQPGPYLDARGVRRAFAHLVGDLERRGYLGHVFPRPCVDDQDAPEPDQARSWNEGSASPACGR